MPIARAIRGRLAGMRAAAYARLEEIPFRTGVRVLAGAAAVIAVIAAAVVASGGAPAVPAHRRLAGPQRPASPSPPARPPVATGPSRGAARLAPLRRGAGPASRPGRSGGSGYYVAASVVHRTASAPHEDLARRPGWRAFGHRDRFPWPRFGRPGVGGHGRGRHGVGRHRGGSHATRAHRGGRGPRRYGGAGVSSR